MQRRCESWGRGFTLIEILITLTIIALLAATITTTFINYAARQSFASTVLDVRDGLIEARSKTLASQGDTIYGVHVSSTAVTFFEGAAFSEGVASNVAVALPGDITAAASFTGGGTSATFTRLTGLPSATGTIVLSDLVHNNTATITLSATGLVE